MGITNDDGPRPQCTWARPAGGRTRNLVVGTALAAIVSLACTACGSGPSRTVTLSVSSGPPGTLVKVSGNAGSGCTVGKNWFGFQFERYGDLTTGPVTQMTTPVAPNGSWSATFVVPSYLGGSAARGTGAQDSPGHYQFAAPSCKQHILAKGSFQVTGASLPAKSEKDYVGIVSTLDGQGYWLFQADGGVAGFGDAKKYGSPTASSTSPGARVVGLARTYDDGGYWMVTADGHVYNFGDAHPYGSLPTAQTTAAPIVGIATTPNGKGYWLLGSDGHVYGFGDAHVEGMPGGQMAPYDAIGARPAGGYVVTASSNAATYLYPGNILSGGGLGAALSAMLVATAITPSGNGTWQAGTDGGVITTGDAAFYGSVPSENGTISAPITGIAGSPDGHGYWLVGANGAVFSFGSAHFFGSVQSTS